MYKLQVLPMYVCMYCMYVHVCMYVYYRFMCVCIGVLSCFFSGKRTDHRSECGHRHCARYGITRCMCMCMYCMYMHTYIHYHHHHLLLLCRGRACVWRGQWGGGRQELSHGQEDALSRVPEREGSLETQIQG